MRARPIDANALRKRIEEWMQELEQEFTVEYAYMGYAGFPCHAGVGDKSGRIAITIVLLFFL